jgi:hypothetical protein
MTDLHVFNIEGKVTAYRKTIERHLGYKINIRVLRDINKDRRDILEGLDYKTAQDLALSLELNHGADVAFVFENDPVTKTL